MRDHVALVILGGPELGGRTGPLAVRRQAAVA